MQSALRRTAAILLLSAASCSAQTASSQTAPSQAPMQPPATQQKAQPPAVQPETHITAAQAKELFRSVDEILDFASKDTGLPIRSKVKRRLTTRAVVEKYLDERMKDDKDARRMERSEIVLKKFGLIDRDFQLRPFLVSLLKEQIAGYYDSKTKTVNLLDWIDPESQKPVLAHELTHALQDQRVGLEKWGSQTDEKLSRNFAQDRAHIASDEDDTAREAVLEGQSMAVFIDYGLMPSGRSLLTNPEVIQSMTDDMVNDPSSPVLSRAPLLLQESLLFPYRDGLRFEAALLGDKGRAAAYAAPLDVPPSSSYEIINPRAYESRKHVPVLNMPDVHPLLDAGYEPYDIGVMGQLDVRILAQLFGGGQAEVLFTPAWDGGLYYAAQRRDAADKSSTASVGLVYLSQWKTPEEAAAFATLYGSELGKKYSRVAPDTHESAGEGEHIYTTSEGPVLITVSGRLVFVSESFPIETARKLQLLMTGAQQSSGDAVAMRMPDRASPAETLARFSWHCGLLRAALRTGPR